MWLGPRLWNVIFFSEGFNLFYPWILCRLQKNIDIAPEVVKGQSFSLDNIKLTLKFSNWISCQCQ